MINYYQPQDEKLMIKHEYFGHITFAQIFHDLMVQSDRIQCTVFSTGMWSEEKISKNELKYT